jgi:hypothetical protein
MNSIDLQQAHARDCREYARACGASARHLKQTLNSQMQISRLLQRNPNFAVRSGSTHTLRSCRVKVYCRVARPRLSKTRDANGDHSQ